MEIILSPEAEQFIREQIAGRPHVDASAVIEAALMMWRHQQAETPDIPGGEPWTLETLRAAIQVGIDQLDRGETVDSNADDIMRRVDEQLERERHQRERDTRNQKVG